MKITVLLGLLLAIQGCKSTNSRRSQQKSLAVRDNGKFELFTRLPSASEVALMRPAKGGTDDHTDTADQVPLKKDLPQSTDQQNLACHLECEEKVEDNINSLKCDEKGTASIDEIKKLIENNKDNPKVQELLASILDTGMKSTDESNEDAKQAINQLRPIFQKKDDRQCLTPLFQKKGNFSLFENERKETSYPKKIVVINKLDRSITGVSSK